MNPIAKAGLSKSPLRPPLWAEVTAICALLISFIPCATASSEALSENEYSVISAALDHGLGDAPGEVVVAETTTGQSVSLNEIDPSEDQQLKDLGTSAIALREWWRVNRERQKLAPNLTIRGTYTLLTDDNRQRLFNVDDPTTNWQRFRNKFDNAAGIIRVSRPGIDPVFGVALLYLEFECGPQCGSGRAINLTLQEDGQWLVTGGTLMWITSPE